MRHFILAKEQSSNPRSRTVLLVEDDQAIRLVLRRPFTEAGFQIFEASTGREALEALDHNPPDLVILELGLPDGLIEFGIAATQWT